MNNGMKSDWQQQGKQAIRRREYFNQTHEGGFVCIMMYGGWYLVFAGRNDKRQRRLGSMANSKCKENAKTKKTKEKKKPSRTHDGDRVFWSGLCFLLIQNLDNSRNRESQGSRRSFSLFVFSLTSHVEQPGSGIGWELAVLFSLSLPTLHQHKNHSPIPSRSLISQTRQPHLHLSPHLQPPHPTKTTHSLRTHLPQSPPQWYAQPLQKMSIENKLFF